jgi:Phage integrase family
VAVASCGPRRRALAPASRVVFSDASSRRTDGGSRRSDAPPVISRGRFEMGRDFGSPADGRRRIERVASRAGAISSIRRDAGHAALAGPEPRLWLRARALANRLRFAEPGLPVGDGRGAADGRRVAGAARCCSSRTDASIGTLTPSAFQGTTRRTRRTVASPSTRTAGWRRSCAGAASSARTRSCSAPRMASSSPTSKTAWESLLLVANGHDTKRAKPGARVDREKLREIDLHWHDLRHEGACRLLADGVDIRIIQLMLGHASVQQTQRYLNVTDEELRKGLEVSWKRRTLKAVGGGQNA